MPHYHFTVRDHEGRRTSGTIDAQDRELAMKMLSERNLFVTSLMEEGEAKSHLEKFLPFRKPGVSGEELLAFTQELATLLEAGIPMRKVMDTISLECANPTLRQILIEVGSGLSYGTPLSQLLRRYPRVFSKLYVAMAAIGETSGRLPNVLSALASYIETTEDTKRKIKAAVYYPAIIFSFAILILAAVFLFGVPFIRGVYENLGTALPLPTRILLQTSDALTRHITAIIVVVLTLVVVLKNPPRMRFLSERWDTIKLNIPLLGAIFRRVAISRFARALATVSASGIPLLAGMELVHDAAENKRVAEVVERAIDTVRSGGPVVEQFRKSPFFTPISVSMIAAGEESGTMDVMLMKLADFYERQLGASLKILVGLVEPAVMILVGLLVAAIVVGLGLPFLNLVAAFRAGT